MEPTTQKILDKIVKLLKLSENNTNTNEAAAAFAQAQSLLSKHRLTMAEVENNKSEGDQEKVEIHPGSLYVGQRVVHWKRYLGSQVCSLNGCKMFIHTNYNPTKTVSYRIVGRKTDIEICQYLFNSIVSQIEILCKNYMAAGHGSGKTFSNQFKLGATETVVARLKAAAEEVKKEYENSTAMVLVRKRDAEVQKFVEQNLKLKAGTTSPVRSDATARELGRQVGHRVSLNHGLNGTKTSGSLN